MIAIHVQKTQARAELDAPVTSGSVGREVQFQFSADWSGLTQTAVFETNSYRETCPVPESGTVAIPKDVLALSGYRLRIGVIGKSADGTIVIPTVYADCGEIEVGASTALAGSPPTPSQAEHLQAQIDELRDQCIEVDTTLSVSGKAADAGAVGEYFTQAMMTISEELANKQPKGDYVKTVNGQTPDADGNVVIEGGGGGVTSWNDLTDKPFYEEVSLETVVPEETYSGFVFLSGLNLYGKAGMNWFSLQEGAKYIVRWEEQDWPVTAFKMAQQGMEAIVLGNEKLLSGESATPVEPFVVYQILDNNYCAICAMDAESSHTVGVFKDDSVIKPLDAKFLPSPTAIDLSQFESNGKIVETFADGTTKTTTVAFDSNGKPVKITDSTGNTTNLSW